MSWKQKIEKHRQQINRMRAIFLEWIEENPHGTLHDLEKHITSGEFDAGLAHMEDLAPEMRASMIKEAKEFLPNIKRLIPDFNQTPIYRLK